MVRLTAINDYTMIYPLALAVTVRLKSSILQFIAYHHWKV
jgi:hypothetical protein